MGALGATSLLILFLGFGIYSIFTIFLEIPHGSKIISLLGIVGSFFLGQGLVAGPLGLTSGLLLSFSFIIFLLYMNKKEGK